MKKITYLIILIALLFPLKTFGANIFFGPIEKRVGLDGEFMVDLFVDPQGEFINAISGEIIIPSEYVDFIDYQDGNSVIPMWIEKPSLDGNILSFAGIMPGGFDGVREVNDPNPKAGKVLSLILSGKKVGNPNLTLQNVTILLNDGLGTKDNVSIIPFTIDILDFKDKRDLEEDTTPPGSFSVEIVQDNNLFNGKYFIIFNAIDKESGIDRYEISETKQSLFLKRKKDHWREANSPHVLGDQSLSSIIKVKAIDKYGNERISEIPPRNDLATERQNYLIAFIIIILILIIYYIRKIRKKREKFLHEL